MSNMQESFNKVKRSFALLFNSKSNKAVDTINQTIELNDTTTSLIKLKLAKFNITNKN